MAKIIAWISNHLTGLLVAGLVAYLALGPLGNCGIGKLEKRLATLETMEREHAVQDKAILSDIAGLGKQNQDILASNKVIDDKIGKTEGKILMGIKDIKSMQENRPEYPPECKPIVEALEREIKAWSNQFDLAIQDKDFWKDKSSGNEALYLNQIKITDNVTLLYNNKLEENAALKDVVKSLQSRLNFKVFESTAFRIVIVIAGGYIAYKLIRK